MSARKLISLSAAIAASLIIASPVQASSAHTSKNLVSVEDGSSENSTEGTKTPKDPAAVAAKREWAKARRAIEKDFNTAVREARTNLREALKNATSQEEKKAAKEAFKEDLKSAKAAKISAIKALGPAPTKPTTSS